MNEAIDVPCEVVAPVKKRGFKPEKVVEKVVRRKHGGHKGVTAPNKPRKDGLPAWTNRKQLCEPCTQEQFDEINSLIVSGKRCMVACRKVGVTWAAYRERSYLGKENWDKYAAVMNARKERMNQIINDTGEVMAEVAQGNVSSEEIEKRKEGDKVITVVTTRSASNALAAAALMAPEIHGKIASQKAGTTVNVSANQAVVGIVPHTPDEEQPLGE